MHRRSYLPQSVNVMSTLNRAKRKARGVSVRAAREAEREAWAYASERARSRSERGETATAQPSAMRRLFSRVKQVLSTPITLPRVFRNR